jgi:peptidoglycan/xylan/chitin deacetylase (PgdA/CDA1 family)
VRPSAAAIVRCGDGVGTLYSTLRSVRRQSLAFDAVIVTVDDTTPSRALPWIRAAAEAEGCRVVAAPRAPGAGRNAAIGAGSPDVLVCVDAGDRLADDFLEQVAPRFDTDDLAFVTTWVQTIGPGAERVACQPLTCDPRALLAAPESVCGGFALRRRAWQTVGGFDDHLEALDIWELALRLVAKGWRGEVVPAPLLVRVLREGSPQRRAWARDLRARAVEAIVARHAGLFDDPAQALYERELRLVELAEAYRGALDRRDRAQAEMAALGAARPSQAPVDWGDFARTTPIAPDWGYPRGRPVDRYYIERFLEGCHDDITGVVLEVQEDDYTRTFGGGRVVRGEVVDLDSTNPRATLIADLRAAHNIPSESFTCIILTQTLHVVDDMDAVVEQCRRLLAPGGVLLVTLPCASRVCLEYGVDDDFWRVTEAGARRLFERWFPPEAIAVRPFGNVRSTTAFLYGLAAHELETADLDVTDPFHPLLVGVRAVKPAAACGPASSGAPAKGHAVATRRTTPARGAIVMYHRVADEVSSVHPLAVSPAEFRRQIERIAAHFEPVTLSRLVTEVREGRVTHGSVAITFDDGYADNLETASPVLWELGVPATFFIVTGGLDETIAERDPGQPFWWDLLACLVVDDPPAHSELELNIEGALRRFATTTAAGREAAHGVLYDIAQRASPDERGRLFESLAAWHGRRLPPLPARMTLAGLRELAARPGHAIGAHGHGHLVLPRHPADVQRRDLASSKASLEALIRRPVDAFAYPYGALDGATPGLVQGAGFTCAATCEPASVTAASDVFRLPRIDAAAVAPERLVDVLRRVMVEPRATSR